MKIVPLLNNYIQNFNNHSLLKISFGELDGDYYDYSPCKITREQYEAKKDTVNEKYDKMRAHWLNLCDDIEINNRIAWNEIHRIEELRTRELNSLEQEYRTV
jgi:hypothetical protein